MRKIPTTKILAESIRAYSTSNNLPRIITGHAHQIVAACFGYGSLSALQTDVIRPIEAIVDAKILIPNIELIESRCALLKDFDSKTYKPLKLANIIVGCLRGKNLFTGEVWPNLKEHIATTVLPDLESQILTQLHKGLYALKSGIGTQLNYQPSDITVQTKADGLIINAKATWRHAENAEGFNVSLQLKCVAGSSFLSSPSVCLPNNNIYALFGNHTVIGAEKIAAKHPSPINKFKSELKKLAVSLTPLQKYSESLAVTQIREQFSTSQRLHEKIMNSNPSTKINTRLEKQFDFYEKIMNNIPIYKIAKRLEKQFDFLEKTVTTNVITKITKQFEKQLAFPKPHYVNFPKFGQLMQVQKEIAAQLRNDENFSKIPSLNLQTEMARILRQQNGIS